MKLLFLIGLLTARGLYAAPAEPSLEHVSPDEVSKAIAALKENFVRPDALSDAAMARATLEGLLAQLAPEATLATGTTSAEAGAPFYSEIFDGKTGYVRPGALTAENIEKTKEALKEWSGRGIRAVVLDLRGTPASSDFAAGAELEGLFCAKGTEMFNLRAGPGRTLESSAPYAAGARAATVSVSSSGMAYAAAAEPMFTGILVVLVDSETAEAPEAVSASLQKCAKALVVGDKTAGRTFEYRDFALDGSVLRVAVAQVMLPDGKEPGEDGLKPDIEAAPGGTPKGDLMRSVSAKGIGSVIQEYDRPHLNEAALVAGRSPEVDELEAEEAGKKPAEALIDRQIERALDLVTSILIYRGKGG